MSQPPSPLPSSSTSTRPTSTAPASAPFSAPSTQSQSHSTGPSPETLDILPALYEILNRTLPPVPGASSSQPGATQPAFPGQQPLDINQLAGEVSGVRARIRKARREVQGLPDVERSVEEQEEEMRFLRGRIRRQGEVLEGLKGKVEGVNGGG